MGGSKSNFAGICTYVVQHMPVGYNSTGQQTGFIVKDYSIKNPATNNLHCLRYSVLD